MANSVEYFGITGDDAVDGLTNGYRWLADSQNTLSYSLSGGFSGEYFTNPDLMLGYFGDAIESFSDFADIGFRNAGQYDTPIAAYRAGSDINLSIDGAGLLFPSPSSWALGFFPATQYLSSPYAGAAGDVFINTQSAANSLPSYAPGSQGYFLLLHEIGHSLGLKHPHDDGGTGRPTFNELGIGRLDQDYVSIMSYNDDAAWNLIEWDPATPMVFDVIAMQYLYGKNPTTNAGDSFIEVQRTGMYHSIWDASGTDTVSAATAGEGWLIELPSFTISDLVDTKIGRAEPLADLQATVPQDLVWLLGDMENALGSNYDDLILGNDLDNWLQPQGGNDRVDGGGGSDMVLYNLNVE
ncbi:MAG TPA: M10 family metallopeptidase, partial [Orrella sp.]